MDYFLATDDVVGISFWIATAVMAAGALFFWMERSTVKASWQTSLTVAALVCFVAFWHYMYMRDVWVATGESPTVYRYIDWLVTVPMQIVEFYLILAACTAVSLGVFWKLLAGSLVMLLGGYLGETGVVSAMVGFVVGMAGWVFIIYYIFVGEAAQIKDSAGNENLVMAFDGIKWIVTIGWAIYPIGYFLGYLGGGVDSGSLNTIYNLADLVNKFLFGLVIWHAAMRDSGVTKS
ncbi:MAG: bacteriorhodopsin [Gammaproteobacteria bacterium]|uniref:Biphenyl 2,3-dioxygenase n=1 Tax=SAR86 cluster bacterium TaxID=2030880 RepID=A0A520MRL1_9GAMM|nr:MAG: biphenyl 2,3-dioxygenase [SAR86 cluster bacterium]